MWVGTFHGLCHRMLRMHTVEAGLKKGFQILDAADQKALVKRLLKAKNPTVKAEEVGASVGFINHCKEHGLRAKDVGEDDAAESARNIYFAYEEACEREGVVDFAELLLRCHDLLKRCDDIRRHYQERFRFVLVDEFQDTNVLQYRWLKLLCGAGEGADGKPKNVAFAVGDDDQSIYAFRGARVGNMADFMKDFGVKSPVRLEQNYRSTGVILDAANGLIAQNAKRLGKNLWTSGERGSSILVKEFEDNRDEAEWVAGNIRDEHRRSGLPWRDYAVLYRTNAQSLSVETALTAAGVPYRVYGGLRFFERAEVKDVMAYLRMLENPNDDTSFLRVVNLPARGVGAKSVASLTETARANGLSLWGVLTRADLPHSPKIDAFARLIWKIRKEAIESGASLPDLVLAVVRGSGLEALCEKDKEKGEDRLANMKEIASAAIGFLQDQGLPVGSPAFRPVPALDATPLQGFLGQATLEAGDKNEPSDTDAVQLMTVHSAKGLEFHQVTLVGVEQGVFPHFAALTAEGKRSAEDSIAEERRLMYVAVTRAKRRLLITHCRSRFINGGTFENELSQFVNEMPQALLTFEPLAKRGSWWDEEKKDAGRRFDSGYGYERVRGAGRAQGSGGGFEMPRWKKPEAAGSSTASGGWRAGQKVRHAKFGVGKVLSVHGSGTSLEIRVRFEGGGPFRDKTLLPSAIPGMLERIGD